MSYIPDISIVLLVYFFTGSLISYTICILIFGNKGRERDIWILSNIVGILGMLFLSNIENEYYVSIGISLTILSGSLKSLAFSGKNFWFKRYFLPHLFLLLSLICASIVAFYPDIHYRRNYFLLGMFFALAASLMYLLRNRQWYGLKQKGYAVAGMALGMIAVLFVIGQAFPFVPNQRLVESSARGVANFSALCLASLAIQLLFLALIFGQSQRERERQLRRNAMLSYEIRLKQATLIETNKLADERQNLIKMLTHEVRQPLNTAQAALQSISADVAKLGKKAVGVKSKLTNMVTVLNSITLSISNSLLGATLISNRRKPELVSIDICDVSKLAYLDINPIDQPRINLQFVQPHIFAEADPIVLRLALRNLLENAVKYSPAETPIIFKIGTDEDRLSVQFAITNRLIDKAMLDGDIFARNKRGVDSRYNGDGLGLFIVSEVAKMHQGTLGHNIADNEVTFHLEIPA